MCFYKPSKDLVPGQTYRLFRNQQNPKDGLCIEVQDRQWVRASLNRNVLMLLAPLVDNDTIKELKWRGNETCFNYYEFFGHLITFKFIMVNKSLFLSFI